MIAFGHGDPRAIDDLREPGDIRRHNRGAHRHRLEDLQRRPEETEMRERRMRARGEWCDRNIAERIVRRDICVWDRTGEDDMVCVRRLCDGCFECLALGPIADKQEVCTGECLPDDSEGGDRIRDAMPAPETADEPNGRRFCRNPIPEAQPCERFRGYGWIRRIEVFDV